MRARSLLLLIACVHLCAATACAGSTPTRPTGTVRVAALGTRSAAGVVRVVLEATAPGEAPVRSELQQVGSASWSAWVSGLPAARGWRFAITAYDAAGRAAYGGSAAVDVFATGVTFASALLEELDPAAPAASGTPNVDALTLSASTVPPGASVALGLAARGGPGAALAYRWTASCGTFDRGDLPAVSWTAPTSEPQTCHLAVTATDGSTSTTTFIDLVVSSTRAVSGTRRVTYWPGLTSFPVTVPAPEATSRAAPSALVRSSDGTWSDFPGGHTGADGRFVPGACAADGSFVVPGVPLRQPYLLAYPLPDGVQGLLDTGADALDLGEDVLGVPGRPLTGAPATFQLYGLQSWTPAGQDAIDVVSLSAGFSAPAVSGNGLPAWTTAPLFAVDAAAAGWPELVPGDDFVAEQLTTRSAAAGAATLVYAAAARASRLPPDPAAATIASLGADGVGVVASLAPVAQTGRVGGTWDTPGFEHLLGALGPAGVAPAVPAHTLIVGATAFGANEAPPVAMADPRLLSLVLPAGATRFDLPDLTYGQFLSPVYVEWREARFAAKVRYALPGTTVPLDLTAEVVRRDALPGAPGVITPAIGPVRAPAIAGQDALGELVAPVGTTPRISWSPPDLGTPDGGYLVEIHRLDGVAGATHATLVLRYGTPDTQAFVPPGLLASGNAYFARITALHGASPRATAPLRAVQNPSWASVLTGAFTP